MTTRSKGSRTSSVAFYQKKGDEARANAKRTRGIYRRLWKDLAAICDREIEKLNAAGNVPAAKTTEEGL
ncbi:MAG TPA: hypothetical protein VN688_12470 [Gemmataceae bacterium]|nr:hypothetical protein [Gemmataceae bacterium]